MTGALSCPCVFCVSGISFFILREFQTMFFFVVVIFTPYSPTLKHLSTFCLLSPLSPLLNNPASSVCAAHPPTGRCGFFHMVAH